MTALSALSSYHESDEDPPGFFGSMSATVAELCRARRAAFWRLGTDGTLRLQPAPFGFASDSAVHEMTFQVTATGDSAIERAVFADELTMVDGSSAKLDRLWRQAGLSDVQNSIVAAWRAGELRIGAIAAYDSRHRFAARDVAALRLVGMTAGLVVQYRVVSDELRRTAARLEEAGAARRHLLNNIAAGGDEARRRFANALRDDSLQMLTGAELQVERMRSDRSGGPPATQLDELRATLWKVEDSLRRLLTSLSPEPLPLAGDLGAAIGERLESTRVRAGIEPHFDFRLHGDVPPAIRSIALKNISEALSNVEKHARATQVTVVAEEVGDAFRFEVSDNGVGFVVRESGRVPSHIGLLAMRERVLMAGGWCRVESDPGLGTKVEFGIPLGL